MKRFLSLNLLDSQNTTQKDDANLCDNLKPLITGISSSEVQHNDNSKALNQTLYKSNTKIENILNGIRITTEILNDGDKLPVDIIRQSICKLLD